MLLFNASYNIFSARPAKNAVPQDMVLLIFSEYLNFMQSWKAGSMKHIFPGLHSIILHHSGHV